MRQERIAPFSHPTTLYQSAVIASEGDGRTAQMCLKSLPSAHSSRLRGQRSRQTTNLRQVHDRTAPRKRWVANPIHYISRRDEQNIFPAITLPGTRALHWRRSFDRTECQYKHRLYIVSIPHGSCHVCIRPPADSRVVSTSPRPRRERERARQRTEVFKRNGSSSPLRFCLFANESSGARERAVIRASARHNSFGFARCCGCIGTDERVRARAEATRTCVLSRGAPWRARVNGQQEKKKKKTTLGAVIAGGGHWITSGT